MHQFGLDLPVTSISVWLVGRVCSDRSDEETVQELQKMVQIFGSEK